MSVLLSIFVMLIGFIMTTKENITVPEAIAITSSHGGTDKPFAEGTSSFNIMSRQANRQKATNDQLIESYNRLKNIWDVAEEFGMCGQSVQERLVRLGIKRNNPHITDIDLQRIRVVYEKGIIYGDGKLKKLSIELNRTIPFISRKAKSMGLTTYSRKRTEQACNALSNRAKKWHETHEHPRGMLNHTHTAQVRENIGRATVLKWMSITRKEHFDRVYKARLTRMARGIGSQCTGDNKKTWKGQWATVGFHYHYFRSSWEVRYAEYLHERWNNGEIEYWEPESCTFWFEDSNSPVRSYKPDFCVYENDKTESFHEVKGWMDDRSKECLRLMDKEYPEIKIVLIDSKRYKQLFGSLKEYIQTENINYY